MPDSYFAFLSNQKKLAEPDKVNGAVKDLGTGRAADGTPSGKHKVKSRASQPNIAPGASVPALPSIQRNSTGPMRTHQSSGPQQAPLRTSGSRPPQLNGSKPPSAPSIAAMSMRNIQMSSATIAPPSKSNALVFVLVGVLVAAIIVLAYLVLTK